MKNTCIIIGGGIIGMMSAKELLLQGWNVIILEQGNCGSESSWAGGGILSPLYPWLEHESIDELARFGQQCYPLLAEQLRVDTGIDPEWISSGMFYLDPAGLHAAISWLEQRQIPFQHNHVPFHQKNVPALLLPSIAQIRPPRLTKGLKRWLLQNGVTIVEQSPVQQLQCSQNAFRSVVTETGEMEADCVVLCTGAWTGHMARLLNLQLDIKPVKGQIIAFDAPPNLLPAMRIHRSHYLIPRRDGLILAGSTVEDDGFSKQTSIAVKEQLWEKSVALCPALSSCPVVHHWAGLRPGTSRSTPYICKLDHLDGVYLNAGHFRSGLTLAPASAKLICDIILNRVPTFHKQAFEI